MKTQRKAFILFLTLLAMLCVPHRASAYYDPSVQRWLQRDPLGEPGFESLRGTEPDVLGDGPNFYLFVGGNPVDTIDPSGLAGDISLGGGYSCRVDRFTTGGTASHEIHVYGEMGAEMGVFGPNGWIPKHGFTRPPQLPPNVANALNGVSIDVMRNQGLIPRKGRGNITALRGRLGRMMGMFGQVLAWLPDVLADMDRALRAHQSGKTFMDQWKDDVKHYPTIRDPFGNEVPNPWYGCAG